MASTMRPWWFDSGPPVGEGSPEGSASRGRYAVPLRRHAEGGPILVDLRQPRARRVWRPAARIRALLAWAACMPWAAIGAVAWAAWLYGFVALAWSAHPDRAWLLLAPMLVVACVLVWRSSVGGDGQ